MKTGTLRTAGAAALGIAFAAAAAGPAAAAGGEAGGGVLGSLPVEPATHHLPGAQQAAGATQHTLGKGAGMLPAALAAASGRSLPARGIPVGQGNSLQHTGLPTGTVGKALHAPGLPGGGVVGR